MLVHILFKKNLIQDENDDSMKFLMEANHKSERIWHYYIRFLMGGFAISTTANAVASFVMVFNSDDEFDTEKLYRVYRIR